MLVPMDYWRDLRDKVGKMPLIMTGAAGAILKEGRLLLVRHKGKRLWQVPGGLQELGESLEDTVAREIRE
jgi:ADP-ribose pyrophosphatase YjhB (NUDIX family)